MKKHPSTFYCFSPEVMLGTFVIEVALALYILVIKGLKTPVHTIICITLVLLALFQLIEYLICQSHDAATTSALARAGLVVITFLPPLGLHISSAIVLAFILTFLVLSEARGESVTSTRK